MPGNSSAQLKLAQGRSRSSVRQRSAAHTISTTDFVTRLAYTVSAFAQRRNFLFADFRLAATLANASVSWSTTSFVNLSALYSSFFVINSDWAWCSGIVFVPGCQQIVGMVFLFIMPGIISAMGNLHAHSPGLRGFLQHCDWTIWHFGFPSCQFSCWSLPWRLRLVFLRDGLSIFRWPE